MVDKTYNDLLKAGIDTNQARDIYFAFENSTIAQMRDELEEWLKIKKAEHDIANQGDFYELATILNTIAVLMWHNPDVRKHFLKEIIAHKKAQK
tara:strand:+ start:748 stop:1029 length:282 start_codon:yes stop_codon:yes gene_type:complete